MNSTLILANDPVQNGRDAWSRIQANDKKMRDDWLVVGAALDVGRQLFITESGGLNKTGFGRWCEDEGFGDLLNNKRSDTLWLLDNKESVLLNKQITFNDPTNIRNQFRSLEKQKQIAQAKQAYLTKEDNQYSPPIVKNTNAVDQLNAFQDNSIDLLLTDPPYSTDVSDIYRFTETWLPLALSKIKPSGRAYICIGAYPKEINAYLSILLNQEKFILDNPLVWTYRNTLGQTPKMKYNLNYQLILHLYSENSPQLDTSITNEMFSVQDINAPDGRQGNRLHTWQKPDELADRLVRHSTTEFDVVVDPFCCTGTFLLAAAKQNRVAIGSDIDMDNLSIAIDRGCMHVD